MAAKIKNIKEVSKRVFLRPKDEDSMLLTSAPTTAPYSMTDAKNADCLVDRSRAFLMAINAPFIRPWSKPNKSPPREPTIATNSTYPFSVLDLFIFYHPSVSFGREIILFCHKYTMCRRYFCMIIKLVAFLRLGVLLPQI